MSQGDRDKGTPAKCHDPTAPYNRRQSLFGRVTNSVRDMFSPSWLVDLVNSVKKKTPPQGIAHPNDQSHWPQTSNAQFSSMQTHVQGFSNMHSNSVNTAPPPMPSLDETHTQQYLVRPGVSQEPPMMFQTFTTVNGGNDATDNGSSFLSHARSGSQHYGTPRIQASPDNSRNTTHQHSTDSTSIPDGNSFLWSSQPTPRPNQRQAPAPSSRPSFNNSALGSPNVTQSTVKSMFGTNYQGSPFYEGKTTYGGASSRRRQRLKDREPYQMAPMRKQITPKRAASAGVTGVTSSTAKIILDTLEKLSSPLNDAKRVPTYSSPLDDPKSAFSPAAYKRTKSSRKSQEGPPQSQLLSSTPTIPKTTTITLNTSDKENKESTMTESEPTYSIGNSGPSNAPAGKMRREKSAKHYSKRIDEDEMAEVPQLSTNVTLKMSGVPSFDFSSTFTPKTTTTPSQSIPAATSAPGLKLSTPSESSSGSTIGSPVAGFSFSSPISKVAPDAAPSMSPVSSQFQFSSPTYVSGSKTSHTDTKKDTSDAKPALGGFQFGSLNQPATTVKSAPSLKEGSVLDVLGKSPSQPFSFGSSTIKTKDSAKSPFALDKNDNSPLKPAAQLKSGSVLDVLKKATEKNDKKEEPVASLGAFMKKSGSTWSCPTCMVSNGSDMEKCPCCDTAKPTTTAPPKPVPSASSASSWKCPTCLLDNATDKEKCVCCGSKQTAAQSKTPTSSVAAASSTGSWKCSTCLVDNTADKDKCVCCTSSKPAAAKPLATAKDDSKWSCPTCMVQNTADISKCPCCETAKPAQKPPAIKIPVTVVSSNSLSSMFNKSGTWECEVCLITNKDGLAKCAACETPKPQPKPDLTKTSTASSNMPQGSSLASLFSKPSSEWQCDTCMVSNKPGADACVACTTPNPKAKSKPQQSKPKSTWECDTCMVQNKAEDTKCIACTTLKPGAGKVTTSFTTTGGFKLGPTGGFQFNTNSTSGAPSPFSSSNNKSEVTTTSDKPVVGGFKFAAPSSGDLGVFGSKKAETPKEKSPPEELEKKPEEKKPPTSNGDTKGGFTFGQKLPSAIPAVSSDTKLSNSNGVFGSAPSPFGSRPVTEGKEDSKPSNLFNSIGNTSKPIVLDDRTKSTNSVEDVGKDKKAVGFVFGAPKDVTSNDISASKSTSVVNVFGNSSTPLGGFKSTDNMFASAKTEDQKTSTTKSTDASGGFQFGAVAAAKPAASAFGESKLPGATGGFNFNKTESAVTTSASPAPFTFGATNKSSTSKGNTPSTTSSSSSPFVFGAGATGSSAAPLGVINSTPSNTSTSSATKRTHEDNNEVAAKKPFVFGSQPPASSQPSGGFAFGSDQPKKAAPSFSFGGNAPASSNAFVFGGNASNNASKPLGTGSATSESGGFGGFGKSGFGNASSSAPAFGSGTSTFGAKPGASSGFGTSTNNSAPSIFGGANNTPAPAFGSNSSQPAATGLGQSAPTFAFGQNQAKQPDQGVFQFGASQPSKPAEPAGAPAPSNGGFMFGQQNNPAPAQPAPNPGGFNFSAATPNFNFGATQNASSGAPFKFGGAPNDGSSFSAAPSTASNNRVIRKAVRKIRKP